MAEVTQNCLYRFKYGFFFFLQKRMDSLQEAFIHPLELCEARFIMDLSEMDLWIWLLGGSHGLMDRESDL